MVAITTHHRFRIIVILCVCFSLLAQAVPAIEVQKFAEIDDRLVRILDSPKNKLEWHYMLKVILIVIRELKLYMKDMREDNAEMIQKAYEIYELGKPKFIDHTFSEPDVQEFGKVTDRQLEILHILRNLLDNLWNDFLDILSEKNW
uniref:Prolyl 4-hydroxylase alpha-subunit N-terminal domain-containing protein n=1 Tax=Graphocephala atropunctata TaxID=36148 RepID=A0A1B6KU96_9HEMI